MFNTMTCDLYDIFCERCARIVLACGCLCDHEVHYALACGACTQTNGIPETTVTAVARVGDE